ncbi:paraquat-inducible protein A [Desulfogranum marinum]|uniref:paraquat-inducible protein A n=1 Tax=Desulfogranum marinum TaxID=453220 RepID=UPI001964E798|nr:paraquat-inducible protein A [Desulfogranum marinum]
MNKTTQPSLNTTVTACPSCDLLLSGTTARENHAALCPRCNELLHRDKHNSIVKTFSLSLTALLLYIPALFLPLLTMGILGTESSSSIIYAIFSLFVQQQFFVGFIVLLTAVIFPFFTLLSLCVVSFGLLTDHQKKWMPWMFRHYNHLREWAMTDVFLVGILITIIKMAHSAEINLNLGFFCFVFLVVVTIASQTASDRKLFWSLLEPTCAKTSPSPPDPLTSPGSNSRGASHLVCHTCHKIVWSDNENTPSHSKCPRCGEKLHHRKKNSIMRTWALLCTAVLFTFPANILPIMEVEYFGVPERSTILDGIVYFFQDGSYGIGIIILTASILVPLFKIIGLSIILLSIHFQWHTGLRRKTTMFRLIEFIGRWSMLDIFVIALLCTLVQFGFLSTISTAPAAFYFTCVVVSTMLAAVTFDTRLLWDNCESTS